MLKYLDDFFGRVWVVERRLLRTRSVAFSIYKTIIFPSYFTPQEKMYDVFLHPNVLLDDYFNLYLLSNYIKSFFDAGLPVRNNDRHASEG
jgi:hypothetical protein